MGLFFTPEAGNSFEKNLLVFSFIRAFTGEFPLKIGRLVG